MDWTERHLVDAYVFGYPLVVNVSSLQAIAEHGMGGVPAAGFNAFAHATSLATPGDGSVNASDDTVSSFAQLDLSGGPLLLHVPDTGGAYTVLQFVDAWTNNFAYVGRRATGTREGRFLITPPGWSGAPPDGARVIESPTDVASIVGRFAVEGADDLPRVHDLQARLTLEPAEGAEPLRGIPHAASAISEHLRFWDLLRRWSLAFPPSDADRAYLHRFAQYGLTDHGDPYGVVSRELDEHLEHAFAAGRNRVEELVREAAAPAVNGWQGMPHAFDYNVDHLGLGTIDAAEWKILDRERSYAVRAASARSGLWGTHGYEVCSSGVHVDADGAQLTGGHAYELRLDEAPPADASWSITVYSLPDHHLVANPIARYSIGGRTPGLVHADDGSLAIRLQQARPDDDAAADWLPTPAGDFALLLRVYQPRAAMLDGTYAMPAVARIG